MTLRFPKDYPNIAKISKAALRQNFQVFRNHCGHKVKLCPAVKANAYGHGIEIVAPVFAQAGTDMFAVANLAEAWELSELTPGLDILVFSPDPRHGSDKATMCGAVRAGFYLTVTDEPTLKCLAECAEAMDTAARIHIKVDTGMGRMGVLPTAAMKLISYILKTPALRLEGLYTHFATADEADASFAAEQLRRFEDFLVDAKRLDGEVPLVHAANSAAILGMPESHFNLVRPGISAYGYLPSEPMAGLKVMSGLSPVMRVESQLVLVKNLPTGHTCGYGRTFRANRPTKVGIVPIGYDDGYRRLFSNRAVMQVREAQAPVIGRVSMDQTILDLTEVPAAEIGDTVTVISERRDDPNSVENLAAMADTIPHEITCLLGRRIMRQAIEDF